MSTATAEHTWEEVDRLAEERPIGTHRKVAEMHIAQHMGGKLRQERIGSVVVSLNGESRIYTYSTVAGIPPSGSDHDYSQLIAWMRYKGYMG